MAKTPQQNKDLYRRLRASGVRKKSAKRLRSLASEDADPSRKTREAAERLSAAAEELQQLVRRSEREPSTPPTPVEDGHAVEVGEPTSLRVHD